MSASTKDLSKLFSAAQKAVKQNQAELDKKDGANGNHGTNMVHNLGLIKDALKKNENQPPAVALQNAAQTLKQSGQGGTSQHYAAGLQQVAQQVQGKPSLNNTDIAGMVQTLMQSLPDQAAANPQSAPTGGGDLLGMLGSLTGGGASSNPQGGGDLLGMLGNLAGSSAPSTPSNQTGQSGGGDLVSGLLGALTGGEKLKIKLSATPNDPNALDVGDLMNAGAAFMQAKQGGADTMSAAMQAAMSAMQGGNPMQADSPRAASGGLVAQALLGALTGGTKK